MNNFKKCCMSLYEELKKEHFPTYSLEKWTTDYLQSASGDDHEYMFQMEKFHKYLTQIIRAIGEIMEENIYEDCFVSDVTHICVSAVKLRNSVYRIIRDYRLRGGKSVACKKDKRDDVEMSRTE